MLFVICADFVNAYLSYMSTGVTGLDCPVLLPSCYADGLLLEQCGCFFEL